MGVGMGGCHMQRWQTFNWKLKFSCFSWGPFNWSTVSTQPERLLVQKLRARKRGRGGNVNRKKHVISHFEETLGEGFIWGGGYGVLLNTRYVTAFEVPPKRSNGCGTQCINYFSVYCQTTPWCMFHDPWTLAVEFLLLHFRFQLRSFFSLSKNGHFTRWYCVPHISPATSPISNLALTTQNPMKSHKIFSFDWKGIQPFGVAIFRSFFACPKFLYRTVAPMVSIAHLRSGNYVCKKPHVFPSQKTTENTLFFKKLGLFK